MEISLIVGYILALIVGLLMGMLGAGGSLIFLILVYVLGRDGTLAGGYTLFLVGLTASIGLIRKFRDKEVAYRIGLLIAIPTMLGTLLDRWYLIHLIPDPLFTIGSFTLGKDPFLLTFFSSILLLSSLSMLGFINPGLTDTNQDEGFVSNYPKVIGLSFLIGVISGLVGAGGGVLVVPMLFLLVGMRMRLAIGTSLFVIAIKSMLGFAFGDVIMMGDRIEWDFLLLFVSSMIAGIIAGTYLGKKVQAIRLRRGFGWMLLIMSFLVMINELVLKR